jgi:hypothetical protein
MEYDYIQAKQSMDVQRISDIRSRRKDTIQTFEGWEIEDRDEKDPIENHIASPKESSIIDDAVLAEKTKDVSWDERKDRRKEHEIFRNF